MREPLLVEERQFGSAAMRYDAKVVRNPELRLFDSKDAMLAAEPVSEGGRQAAWYVRYGEHDAVLRHYRRGGLAAKISDNRYIWQGLRRVRSFHEFEILRALYEAGMPVPRPYAAVYWKSRFTYQAAIAVERLHDVQALASALDVADSEQVAGTIFAMHEHGVWHADLNAYNVLLDQEGRAWLIDFDKASRTVLSPERRRANLLRLRRSLTKVAGQRGLAWWERLNHSYAKLTRSLGV